MSATHLSSELTRIVLGMDAYYRQQQNSNNGKLDAEGLVPVHWAKEPPLELFGWGDAKEKLLQVITQASLLPEPLQRDWLTAFALSLLTLARWFDGEDIAYEEIVAGALQIDPRPPTRNAIQVLVARRDAALKQAGYASYDAYKEKNIVAKQDITSVMTALLAEGRVRTQARLPMLAFPPEPATVMAVEGVPFSAYCDYPGKKIWINTDVPYTYAALKHLVGHEAYPGHYTHMYHRDALRQEERMLADSALVVTNTASSVLFEGIAELGLDLLGWRDTPEDQISWWHNRLLWACSIEVAHALNTGRASSKEMTRFLQQTCNADDAWIQGKLAFVTHRLRAPFVYGYWWGGTVVGRWWQQIPATKFNDAITYLYNYMHSPASLSAHWQGGQS